MIFYVYMLICISGDKIFSYVGYTNNLKKRLNLHNTSRGAKYTKGRNWTIIYKKKYYSKSKAMKEEYKLKKNYYLRNLIKKDYLEKHA